MDKPLCIKSRDVGAAAGADDHGFQLREGINFKPKSQELFFPFRSTSHAPAGGKGFVVSNLLYVASLFGSMPSSSSSTPIGPPCDTRPIGPVPTASRWDSSNMAFM